MNKMNMGSQLRTPWRVSGFNLYPRIVDADDKPVCSFGNQGRHRGIAWAIIVSREIVRAVNALHLDDTRQSQ